MLDSARCEISKAGCYFTTAPVSCLTISSRRYCSAPSTSSSGSPACPGRACRCTAGLQLHQIDHVDHADVEIRKVFAQDENGGQNLQRGRVPATGHHHVRLCVLVVAGPLPDTDSFRAMPTASSMVSHCAPWTKYGVQPQPRKNCSNSSRSIRASTVGLLLL